MVRERLRFPIDFQHVAAILVQSEGIPSSSKSRAKAHTFSKHQADTQADLQAIMNDIVRLGDSENLTAFRDTTELLHAAWVVLNSAWGR
jgi:hypothetical protein